jgi:predicted nucleic acid-binding Zn ribbon protein
MRERHVTAWLDAAMRRGGWVRGVRRAGAVLAWPRIVGSDVARFATAVAFQNGTLIVEVADAETAMHLGLQRHRILEAYRSRLPEPTVRDLRFRVGRVAPPEVAPPPPPPPPDPTELRHLEQAALGLPDALVPAAAATGRALASLRARRRAAGWRPCSVCGSLTEPDPATDDAPRCATCRRQATLPKVADAAARLAVAPRAPTPALTDDERRVALWLARGRVRALIQDLLPRALADTAHLGALEAAVRCAVDLNRGASSSPSGDPAVPDTANASERTQTGVPTHAGDTAGTHLIDLDDVDPERDGVDPRALRALGRLRRRPPEVP